MNFISITGGYILFSELQLNNISCIVNYKTRNSNASDLMQVRDVLICSKHAQTVSKTLYKGKNIHYLDNITSYSILQYSVGF